MPPRKSGGEDPSSTGKSADGGKAASTSSATAPAGEEGSTATPSKDTPSKEKEKDGVNVEELNLPRTMVQRLAKGVLPPNTQIQKDAMLAMSKSATVFVSYLSSHANELALGQNKKTIMPQNVFDAISELEFEDFLPRLEAELAKYTENQTDKRNSRKKPAADKAAANGASSPKATANGRADADETGDAEPRAKKARRSTLGAADNTEEEQQDASGDDTVSEDDADANAEEGEESEEEGEEAPEEEQLVEDSLETQEAEPPDDDQGSQRSEDSD